LYEDRVHEQTLLELRTSSLLPPESIEKLQKIFGEKFQKLSELQRVILGTADAEGFVSHTRIRSLSTEHPKDISSALSFLVRDSFLEKEGATRDATYHLPGVRPQIPFSSETLFGIVNSPDLIGNSPDLTGSSPDLKPVMDQILNKLGFDKMPGKMDSDKMKYIITEVCKERWVTLKELGHLLDRDPKALQDQYLTPMISSGSLKLKYPETKNHPNQAYWTES
jgi:hypothetical protein